MELRRAEAVRCYGCPFAGTVIDLYAKCEQLSLLHALQSLIGYGVFPAQEADHFAANRGRQNRLNAFFREAAQDFRDSRDQVAIHGLNQLLYVDLPPEDIRRLCPAVCWLSADDLHNEVALPKAAKSSLRTLGRRHAIMLPSYSGVDVTGCWALGEDFSVFIPFADQLLRPTATMLPHARVGAPLTVAVDTALDSLRLTAWSTMVCEEPVAFVHPHGKQLRCDWSATNTLHWSPTNRLEWSLRALNNPESMVVCHDFEAQRDVPCGGNWSTFVSLAARFACPAPVAAGRQLVALPEAEARAAISSVYIGADGRRQIIAGLDGADRGYAQRMFDELNDQQVVIVDGKSVTSDQRGWVSDGRVISTAEFYLENLYPVGTGGDAYATGYVQFDGRTYRFREDVGSIRKNPGEWLHRFVIARAGGICQIAAGWGRKLLDVSTAFQQPQAIMETDRTGWRDGTLYTPNFVLSSHGITPSSVDVDGPSLPFPHALVKTELPELRNPKFLRVCLTFMMNMVRSSRRLPLYGLYLVGERHRLADMARVCGQRLLASLPAAELRACEVNPIPTFVQSVSAEHSVLRTNCVVSVDTATSHVLRLRGGWLHISAAGVQLMDALRVSWLSVPRVLREWDGDEASLAKACAKTLENYDIDAEVAGILASDIQTTESGLATRALSVVTDHQLEETGAGVLLPFDSVLGRARAATLPLPRVNELTKAFKEARMLLDTDKERKAWVLRQTDWQLYRSFAVMSS